MNFIATAAFGLEGIVKRELQEMGIEATADLGCVRFSGGWEEAFRANLWLRCADRVLLVAAEQEARTFEELFQTVKAIRWEELLPVNARIPVTGKCVKSTLMSVRDCQSITKKAIVERMKRAYRTDVLPETGAEYKVDVAFHGDVCRITLDTSGEALNRRGYRTWNGEAPLRETLAAALLKLSPWQSGRGDRKSFMPLHDPCCGTGTLLIEAALIMADRAPGLKRTFAMEEWKQVDHEMISRLRREAEQRYHPENIRGISGSDLDPEALKLCKKHIVQAGLGGKITVFQQDLRELSLSAPADAEEKVNAEDENGFSAGSGGYCFICNPPYGERMSDRRNCEGLYKQLRKLQQRHPGSRLCAITAYVGFEKCVGARAQKKRRLYNGRLECEYLIY